MQKAERGHRPVGGELSRHVAPENSHTVVILVQSLVLTPRHECICLRLSHAQIAAAQHLIDLLIPGAELVAVDASGRDGRRAHLRLGLPGQNAATSQRHAQRGDLLIG